MPILFEDCLFPCIYLEIYIMAVVLLCSSIAIALGTAWLVVIVPSPYDAPAALCGSSASVLLLILSICIDE